MPLDDTSAQWLAALQADGAVRDQAHARLHGLLLAVARSELSRRSGRLRLNGAELDDLAHRAAADAMLSVLRQLPSFRGESRFTTWAYIFAIFEVSGKLGRHFWTRHPTTPLDEADWEVLPGRFGFSVENEAQWRELMAALQHAIEHDRTERQRQVFTAIVVNTTPMDAVCVELDTNRNAVYKTMFDARRRLRAALVAKGLLEEAA